MFMNIVIGIVVLVVLLFNFQRVLAVFRWATFKGHLKSRPTCGDEVWWETPGYEGSERHYGAIDALNEQKNQFLLEGETKARDCRDLTWCKYYQSWEYVEGSFNEKEKKRWALEKARDTSKGWSKCP